MKCLYFAGLMSLTTWVNAQQQHYQYTVDLADIQDDRVRVELKTPGVSAREIHFHLPKIVPGTYNVSDFGKFSHNLTALDVNGKSLRVERINENTWKISQAQKLNKITYWVEDTYDATITHQVYPMAGTNIEDGKNFVINTPGFFGYLDGYKNLPITLSVIKPHNFYGSTSLKLASTPGSNREDYLLENHDQLYDAPLMYCAPDTITIKVGQTQVLVSVYSPNKKIAARQIATNLTPLLRAQQIYLGGKLPVDKYAFIYYFDPDPKSPVQGALEHNQSSFYYLKESDPQDIMPKLVDIAAHEFFHIVTPLTIASHEVKSFNYQTPILSKHLWLYEGVVEYFSHHVQVVAGLNTPEQFMEKLAQKIRISRKYFNDSLSFTELSKESAGQHNQQFPNVYEKGALIAACLDILLLHHSQGQYALKNLIHDLSVRYGKLQPFDDNELWQVIGQLTYPQIADFLVTYVEGSRPIPYEQYFSMAGIEQEPSGKLALHPKTTHQQSMVRNAWLAQPGKAVSPQISDADGATIQHVVQALYEVISGPAGPRDWERFRSLFSARAFMAAGTTDAGGRKRMVSIQPEEYVRNNNNFFLQSGFFEEEINHIANQFGDVAQVFSVYQYRFREKGPPIKRGINSIQLIRENEKWKIASIIWSEETPENPIPKKYEIKSIVVSPD